jgi:hypothetical protein
LRRSLAKDLDNARQSANDLVRRVIHIDSRVSVPQKQPKVAGEGILGHFRSPS